MVSVLGAVLGCAAGSAVETPGQPPDAGLTRVVAGASDSVSVIPGSPDALYLYRFRQVDPASDRFVFQDREVSFYFKPTPDVTQPWIGTIILNFDPIGDVGRIGFGDFDGDGDLDLMCVFNDTSGSGDTSDRVVWIRNSLH